MRVLLAGGTGLVGNAVIEASKTTKIELVGVGRRASGKLSREIVTDLEDIPNLPAARVAICTLGTTQHRAGSREAFRAVDYTAVMKFTTAAQLAGAEHFIVVTAVGATTRSSIFYSRVKGEVESDLSGRRRHDGITDRASAGIVALTSPARKGPGHVVECLRLG